MIGSFEVDDESYENLCKCLNDSLKQIDSLDEISVNNKSYKIIKYLGGDLKFLATFMGLKSAISNYPCVWCKIHKDQLGDLSKIHLYSATDVSKGARTLDESKQILQKKVENKKQDTCGYDKHPVSDAFPFDHVIPDLLHAFLRISQKLMELLLQKIEHLDGKFDADLNKNFVLKRLIDFLENVCKFKKPYKIKDGRIELKEFYGSQYEIIFSNIKLDTILPHEPEEVKDYCIKMQNILTGFYSIYCHLKYPVPKEKKMRKQEINRLDYIEEEEILTSELLKNKTHEWFKLFRSYYHGDVVTPYIHIFVSHFHEFLEMHGDLNLFNQEGLEKLNFDVRQIYRKSTNKKEGYIDQILKKISRIENNN